MSEIVNEFAPTGKLRAAINLGNTVLVQKDPCGGPNGVAVMLAKKLGKMLGVPVELVLFNAALEVFSALRAQAWDIAFLAIGPVRATEIDFTAPYVIIEGKKASGFVADGLKQTSQIDAQVAPAANSTAGPSANSH
jgi:polar amino acid transport system substrate-binding protein